ncbi:MAG: hypothetical protein J5659_02580 [Clostridia bacterium]|nr:hypothetical protein [Clostridia bacterium]
MQSTKKLYIIILTAVLILSVMLNSTISVFAAAPEVNFSTLSGNYRYGIDVSKHNGSIDWAAVKQSGVQFAMIRCGYRGWLTGNIVTDERFDYNILNAYNNGIAVGVYFYSTAVNESEAVEEAAWVASVLQSKAASGISITYPVAYDFEEFYNTDNRSRAKNLSKDQISKNAAAFLNYIGACGYTPLFYAGKNPIRNNFESYLSTDYSLWLANYARATEYEGKFFMWQFTSSGQVNGISGRVDLDVCGFENSDNLLRFSLCNTQGAPGYSSTDFSAAPAIYLNLNEVYFYRNTYDGKMKELKIGGKYYYVPANVLTAPFTEASGVYITHIAEEIYNRPIDSDAYKTGIIIPAKSQLVSRSIWTNWMEIKYGDSIYYIKTDNLITADNYAAGESYHTGGVATCSSKAICSVCHEEYGESDPDNHIGEKAIFHRKSATCTDEGYTGDLICMSCKQVLSPGEPIPATGHKFGWRTTKIATADGEGLKEEICALCGEKTGESKPVDYKEHITGDITDDGSVDNRDMARLLQYLSGWDVPVNNAALDINSDCYVNNADVILLFQYISGWIVEIF